ncbi:MAG TPA: dienelactone hydrolase family protein [Methylomirabilota bacterium]|nr:dienelactone hydrolase family protein [Methylomirabilota bacterium]
MPRHAWAVLAASVLVAGCATAPLAFSFPNATPDHARAIPALELRPNGQGPFPAVVLLHGCHGVSDSTRQWGDWFRERGFVAVIVDSWAPRGVTKETGCVPGEDIPSTERFDDAVGAVRWLHTRSYVDARHIGAIGWSNGGVFSMALINGPSLARARRRGVELPPPGVVASVALYPGGCYSLVNEQVVRPLLLLIGDADDWTLPGECKRMVEAMQSRGADATIVLYPGAVHYFDVVGQPRVVLPEVENRNKPGGCCGATVGFDAAANADARRRVEEFFTRHLKAK